MNDTPAQDEPAKQPSLKRRTLSGMVWQTGAVGVDRVARLALLAALTRVVPTEEMGRLNIVLAVIAAVEAITYLASDQAIVYSKRSHERSYLSTVFWVASIRGVIIALLTLAVAVPIATYLFDQPDLWPLIMLAGSQAILLGLMSPKAQLLVKELAFQKWSIYRLVSSIAGLGVMLYLGLTLQNATGLVIGHLSVQLCWTLGSYVIAPFAPRLTFDREAWLEIKRYGLRAFGTPVLIMLISRAPSLLMAPLLGPAALGMFAMNSRLAQLPTEISLQVVSRVAVPAYSKLRDEPARLKRSWLRALRLVALVALPLGCIGAWGDRAVTRLAFGEDYVGPESLFALLMLSKVLTAILTVTGPLFWGVGEPFRDRRTQIVRLVVLWGSALVAMRLFLELGMAYAMLLAGLLTTLYAMTEVRRILDVSWREIAGSFAPGLALTGAGLAPLAAADILIDPMSDALRLSLLGVSGTGAGCAAAVMMVRDLSDRPLPRTPRQAVTMLRSLRGGAA
jgi:O-antigen/teichoic acid export membrane protein